VTEPTRWSSRRKLSAIVLLAGALTLTACSTAGVAQKVAGPIPANSGQPAKVEFATPGTTYDPSTDPIVAIVQKVEPAVVNVTTRTQGVSSILGGSESGRAVGTGFVLRSDGVIVTNYHVVEGALNIRVTLPDGRSFLARVIGGNSQHDLAVLKVDAQDLPTIAIGDSNAVKLGEPVVALGYALALPGGPTVTTGIISSLARTIQAQDPNGQNPNGTQGITRTYQDVLQTDAAINPGNSGGPLVDLNGNVIGINTAGDSQAENIGFAIAISGALPDIEQAIAHPAARTAYLGVSLQTNSAGLAAQLGLPISTGAVVVQVSPGSAAANAGIKAGDVIIGFDGKTVKTSDDLGSLIDQKSPGDRVAVAIVSQDGSHTTVTATLGVRPLP
jgi:serine protease Do